MEESSTIQAFIEEGRVKGLAEEAGRIILRLGRKRLGAVDETVEAKLNATVDLLKPYWGKPAVWNFKGGRGNPKLDRARRVPLPYSARSDQLTSGDDVRHAVERNVRVAADQLEALVAGLGNQEAVERVAVVRRQRFDGQGVWDGDR